MVRLYLSAAKGYSTTSMALSPNSLVGANRFAAIPLAVAYAAIPLGMALLHFADSIPQMNPTQPWVVLAGIGTICAMLFRRSGVPVKKRFLFEVGMFSVLVAILVMYGRDYVRYYDAVIPYMFEAIPLAMILFGYLWAITFGIPNRADFQRYGAFLAVLCIVDLIIEATLSQTAPTVRWLGNTDILAGLLLVSLCASLKPGENDGGVFEPDQGRPLWRALILIGIAACLSRTGLFAAAWISLCFGRGSRRRRTLISLLLFALIGVTFLLPGTASDSIRYIDYWLWVESVRLFVNDPMLLIAGFPIPSALPIKFPMTMAPIWEAATGSPALLGAYLYHVPSFWLRLILGWGAILPLFLLTTLFILLFRRLTRMGAGLIAALFAQGMTTPLLFDPSMGAIISLGFMLALTRQAPPPNVRKEPADKPSDVSSDAPEPTPNPAKEWDMRPL